MYELFFLLVATTILNNCRQQAILFKKIDPLYLIQRMATPCLQNDNINIFFGLHYCRLCMSYSSYDNKYHILKQFHFKQFLIVAQQEYFEVLNDGKEKQKQVFNDDGKLVVVKEWRQPQQGNQGANILIRVRSL